MGLKKKLKKFFYRNKYKIQNTKLKIVENKNILITGSNSGIGLALTKKLIENNNLVIATYRNKLNNLESLKHKNLITVHCDQEHEEQIENIKNKIKDLKIDILINNTGIWGPSHQELENIDYEAFKKALMINALSAIKFTDVILKNCKKDHLKLIVNISSSAGSIEKNKEGNSYIYRTSKTALNSITKNMSIDLKKKYNINVFAIDPGNVKTNLNSNGMLEPTECANQIIDLIFDYGESLNGKFVDLIKKEIPW